MRKTIL